LHSLSTTLAKVTQNLRRLASELSKPQARFTEQGIRNKISRWLTDSFVREVLHYELQQRRCPAQPHETNLLLPILICFRVNSR
jgi:hypothetical protein